MEKMLKECMKPHAIYHMVIGVGLGLILAAVVPSLATVLIGVVVVVVGAGLDMMMKKK